MSMNTKQLIASVIEKSEQNRYWILSSCLLIVFSIAFFDIPNIYGYGCDFWEYTAALQELSYNLVSPKNPQLFSDVPSSRFMPYILILAVIKSITGLNVFSMMSLASIATFLIFSIGLYFFTKEYFNDKNQAFYTLIVMLFFWGIGFGWSSEYSFKLLRLTFCYPSIFAFALSFSGFYFILKYIKSKNFKYYLYSLVLGFIIFLSHPVTGSFFFLAIFLLVLSEKNNVITKLTVFSLPLIVIIFSCFWPYFSLHELLSKGESPFFETAKFFTPTIIYRIGPALIGLPIVLNYCLKKKYKFVYYGFFSFFAIYVFSYISTTLNAPYTVTFGGRFTFFFLFFLHLAISRELRIRNLLSFPAIKQAFCSGDKREVINILLILILFSSIVFSVGWAYSGYAAPFVDLEKDRIIIHRYYEYKPIDVTECDFLKEKVGRYDVVMSDKTTSWVLPTFSGKAVCVKRGFPLLSDHYERLNAVETFFDADTTTETRMKILRKYNVSYILLNLDLEVFDNETIVAITELGDTSFQNSHFILVEPTDM